MRIKPSSLLWTAILLLAAVCVPFARAQSADELMPAQSAAKARGILDQAIKALGGSAYLNVRNSDCTGRFAQFEHSGAVGGFMVFRDYHGMPDKNRVEYYKKENVIDLYAGKQGWTLDRGGVSEEPADAMADYQEQVATDLNTILRYRMQDPSLMFRYAGPDVVDLREADWVEIDDREGRTIRIAIARATHLPLRITVGKRDPKTGDPTERATYFSNYHPLDGVQTAFQVSRFRNGQETYQIFYDGCKYNEDLPADFFTRASLDDLYAKGHKGGRKGKK